MELLHLKNVDFSYNRRVNLLEDVCLQISAGHIHGLLGKNGEGKSTLLKLVAGLLFPQRGSIDVLGFTPQKRQPELLRNIYFLPEELPIHALRIAHFEEIYAPFYPNFSPTQFNDCLREFNVASKDWKMNELSLGQRKKVMVAFALATRTKILLMDEPTNGLDIPSKGQFRRMVASTLDNDRCILISTHQVRDLDSLIDNIIIMDDHQIVLNESIDTISARLLFRIKETNAPDDTVIHSEDTLRGFYQVCENTAHEDSKLDIELLFNAVYTNKQRIQKLFPPKI
jgi:ABC-2 type transport system ATP-binding protein